MIEHKLSKEELNFLFDTFCAKSPTGLFYAPPKGARCLHHDDHIMWQILVDAQILKTDPNNYSWKFCHKITKFGRDVLIQEIDKLQK
jgi:hypothetical protein